jgi:hypothetical protein
MNKKATTFETAAAVTVTSLAEAKTVIAVAQRLGRPLILLTEPGACARVGPGYLLEMMRQAGCDDETLCAVLDCGEDAGYAMLALRLGWKDLHLTGDPDTIERIRQMIQAAGGRFHADLPPSLAAANGAAVDQRLEQAFSGDASN